MRSSLIKRVINSLVAHYRPFNLLSPERIPEISNIARFMELRNGEIFQLRLGKSRDYLFVVEGGVDVILPGGIVSLVNAKEQRSRSFTLPCAPGTCTLVARDGALVAHVDREMLDKLISWDEVVQMYEDDVDQEMYWRLNMLRNSLVLRSLPLEHVEAAFKRMNVEQVEAGQDVIRAGDDADTFYILTSGKAEMWQPNFYDDQLRLVDEVTVGGNFGNEALISGYKYSVTVRMAEDGTLLSLKKSDFQTIVGKHLVKTVNTSIAKSMLDSGYKLLDVRYEEEFLENYIPGAKLIPLVELRKRIDELDGHSKYVVYCHSGNRSAVAAMILSQHNIESVSLEGGIRDWPYELADDSAAA
jgi:rhodanese-related sulfurtransferase